MATYKIVRSYFSAGIRKRTIATGLTLEQVKAHCNDPETSSDTATNKTARDRTRRVGPWFDFWTKED